MNKALIYHRPLSEYAHPLDSKTIVIRLKTGINEVKIAKLMYGDTAYQGNPVLFTELIMEKIASDHYFDYYEAIITNSYERVVYYFDITGVDLSHTYYYADIFTNQLTIERNDLFKFPFNRIEDVYDVPKWFKEATIYNIFLDSYTTSDLNQPKTIIESNYQIKNKNGGTLKNVIDDLDHIQKMGFDTIYMNPIFCAGEYHKYDTIDYFRVDPLFGTNEVFKELVESIHERKMHIIIDGVFNHSGWYFKPFDDVINNQEKSVYKDWFYELNFPVYRPEIGTNPPYATFGYERLMPKLNTSNPEVIKYFTDVCRYWMEVYHIDGWRLDVADEVNTEFWRIFRNCAKSINKDAVIIGEVWQSAQYYLDGSMFDSAMNYDFIKHAKAFFAHKTIDAKEFNSRVTNMLLRYRTNFSYGQMNLLDSHDVPRFLSHVKEDRSIYKLAVIFLLTFVGVPSVFYGDEEGMIGVSESDYRRPKTFKDDELRFFFMEMIKLRNQEPVLKHGKYKALQYDENTFLYHYVRYNETKQIGIILNNSEKTSPLKNLDDVLVLHSSSYDGESLGSYGYMIYVRK